MPDPRTSLRRQAVFALLLLLTAGLLAGAPARTQTPAPVVVEWEPEQPVQGTLFTLRVQAGEGMIAEVRGRAAGEPLHFFAQPDGTFRALAAVPIDSSGTLRVPLEVQRENGRIEPLLLEIPIAQGSYRMDRLTVAPRFGQPPDAATAARIAAEAGRAREVSRRSHQTPRLWEGEFVLPRDSRITSGFGHGREFNGQVQSRHMGTDFAGAVGAPVRAAARGVVALVDAFHLGGNVLYLDHGAGLVTGYLHLSRAEVAQGDTVGAGQVIGRVGATGRVTGPHLHWIVRYGTVTVDPLSLLQLTSPSDSPMP